jgi:hypothetical protein
MNRLIAQSMAALCFLLFISTTSSAQKIEIKSDTCFINSVIVTNHENMQSLESVFGKPDRMHSLEFKIWTYDNLGIRIYVNQKTSLVESVDLDFIKGEYDFSPRNVFSGTLVINGFPVSRQASLNQLEQIKDIGFKHVAMDIYNGRSASLALTFIYSTEKKELQEMAIGLKE